jgi:WD40 repeat protein
MAGRADASRDLRLGLLALEGGAIDERQLVAALRAWVRAPGRPLADVLAGLGAIDAATRARLEEAVAQASGSTGVGSGSGGATGAGASGDLDATATFAGSGRGRPAEEPATEGPRFEVLAPHARGGLGEVFLAFDRELRRRVALKELQSRLAHDPDAQARFLREAEVTGRLEHPGIVPVYSLGRYPDGRPYYAMRLIEGQTLRDAIEHYHRASPDDGPRGLAFQRLLRSVIDACNAVAYAHSRGVVHRDLKPENIMLGPFGETLVVDWGVAKVQGDEPAAPRAAADDTGAGDASMTRPGSVVGTPRTMSPEQAAGELERVGPASDIYSLGAILYFLLAGRAAFPDGDVPTVLKRVRRGIFPAPRRLRRSVDPRLEAICLKAMALDPGERHASALDLAGDLEAWQADVRYQGEQEQALSEARQSHARLCFERAWACFDRQAHAEGLLWLSRALEHAPAEPPDLQRVVRTNLAAWHIGARLLERSLRHGGAIHALRFCPEGRRLATACGDGTARLWDVATGTPLAPPLEHDGAVRAVAFDPDGAALVTAGDEGLLRRWDALTGDRVGEPWPCGGPAACLAFRPDGARIAAGGPGGLSLWDALSGRVVRAPDAELGPVRALAFSPDGATLAVACDGGAVHLLESDGGAPSGAPLAHGSAVAVLEFDPLGRWLLAGDIAGHARLWDLARRTLLVDLPHGERIQCAGFRPDGDAFATAGTDGTARLWDGAGGRPIGAPLLHRARVACLAFRPDGTLMATGGADGTVRLWCATTGLPIGPPLAHGGDVRALGFSPDGRRLATAGPDALARCWLAPNPVEGDAARIGCWVRVTTELDFDAGDAVRRLDGPTSWDLRRRLTDLGGPPLR